MKDRIRNLKQAEAFYRRRASVCSTKRESGYWLNRAIEYKEKINQLENLDHEFIN